MDELAAAQETQHVVEPPTPYLLSCCCLKHRCWMSLRYLQCVAEASVVLLVEQRVGAQLALVLQMVLQPALLAVLEEVEWAPLLELEPELEPVALPMVR